MTKEQVYRDQMKALGIYQEILEPEIKMLAKIERQITRAEKAWSATATPPGSAPSFLDPHFPIIQRLRDEATKHREILGITAKALAKITGSGSTSPDQSDLISSKLDRIAARVAGYDVGGDLRESYPWPRGDDGVEMIAPENPFAGIPAADEAARISDLMDEELRRAVHEDMG